MKYIKYYVWHVFCSYVIFLPLLYITDIFIQAKNAVLDKRGSIRYAINCQNKNNKKYRVANNIKGLLDPLYIIK